jgi:hypothetical protein
MFGISNYVFIVLGLILILWSLFDYKILNPILFGNKKKYRLGKKVSPLIFKYNKISDYWNILLGIIVFLIGLYGIIFNKNSKYDLTINQINLFHKHKDDKNKI